MGQCQYRYPDGQQCIITSLPPGKNLCTDHRLLVQRELDKEQKRLANQKKVAKEGLPAAIKRPPRKRPKFSQPSRVSSAKEIIDKLPEVPVGTELAKRVDALAEVHGGIVDPSAPWCTCRGGCKCKKPKYNTWARGVGERKRSSK